jgi:hypothetical protein
MRMTAAGGCLLVLGIALLAEGRLNDDCALTLQLTDSETGRPLPGLVRITDADGKSIKIAELLPRDLTPGVEGIYFVGMPGGIFKHKAFSP